MIIDPEHNSKDLKTWIQQPAGDDFQKEFEEQVKARWDNFLDAYSSHQKSQSEITLKLLKRKAIELELVDSTFHFDLDSQR